MEAVEGEEEKHTTAPDPCTPGLIQNLVPDQVPPGPTEPPDHVPDQVPPGSTEPPDSTELVPPDPTVPPDRPLDPALTDPVPPDLPPAPVPAQLPLVPTAAKLLPAAWPRRSTRKSVQPRGLGIRPDGMSYSGAAQAVRTTEEGKELVGQIGGEACNPERIYSQVQTSDLQV